MKTIGKRTSVLELPQTAMMEHYAHQASTIVQYRELLKSMMIGKALSGL